MASVTTVYVKALLYFLEQISDISTATVANIKITRDELRKVGKHSLAFTDDSGFLAELGVYHELHCIVSCLLSLKTQHRN